MSQIILRDYQEEALKAVIKNFQDETFRQLIVIPTGGGKTILMAAIAKHFNKKILLIAHRDELLHQAYKDFNFYWPEVDIGFFKAEQKDLNHQIILGSMQTCCIPKNLKQLKDKSFDILMVDETHHAPAKSYQKIICELGFSARTKKLLLGVTATPMRGDKKDLGSLFDKIAYSISISDLIKAEHLSQVTGRRILTSFNLNGVRTHMGDFAAGELASAVNTKERNIFVVNKFKEHAHSRKALAFCADVKHCHDLAQIFNAEGIVAEAVWGAMDSMQRKRILKALTAGQIQVITSCGLLTEGFNEPSINAILMARPTKSRGLYIQMAGRGLRLYPEKKDCLVLDFADKYHNLNSVINLQHAIPEALYIDEVPKIEKKKIDRTAKIKTLKDIDRKFDILGTQTGLMWINMGDDEYSLTDDHNNELVMYPQSDGYIATLFYKNGDEENIVLKPTTFEDCLEICSNFARSRLDIKYANLKEEWVEQFKKQKPTPSQEQILRNNGIYIGKMNKAQAIVEIRKILTLQGKEYRINKNIPTPAQRFFLENCGLFVDNLTKQQASSIISQIKEYERGKNENFAQR